jgi:signal transduction histidine kinase
MLFSNILDNACQALAAKQGVVSVSMATKGKDTIEVKIEDNGVGMEHSELEKVFEPFFITKPRGVGLGLAIVKDIVDLHNGSIRLESIKNKGTTVIITLPWKE